MNNKITPKKKLRQSVYNLYVRFKNWKKKSLKIADKTFKFVFASHELYSKNMSQIQNFMSKIMLKYVLEKSYVVARLCDRNAIFMSRIMLKYVLKKVMQ